MNVSVQWLQKYFAEPLPSVEELDSALTLHSSEIEEIHGEGENAVLDVKVLPDRAAYALSHRGIAYELAAALDRPLAVDPLRTPVPTFAEQDRIVVTLDNEGTCSRYIAALIEGVTIGPSPKWLQEALTSVGQRSINNVVDATNYVLLNIGQPLHAFDADKLTKNAEGMLTIAVRPAVEGEKITTLTKDEYALTPAALLITDGSTHTPLGIAGIKGGMYAQVDEHTTNILIEAAHFNATAIRKTAQRLKLWTDASLRFQNNLSPELAAFGMRDVLALILEIAGGTFVAATDTYPNPEARPQPVAITREQLNGLLGTETSSDDMRAALTQLALEFVDEGEVVTVRPPFERRDLMQWQDLAEEIGRVLGYEHVAPTPLPAMQTAPDQNEWKGVEAIKDLLTERGFTEISTQSFAAEGTIGLANPLQSEKPWLRASLTPNMQETLLRSVHVAPRVLGPEPMLKLFEIGTVFTGEGEKRSLSLGYQQLTGKVSQTVLVDVIDALTSTYPEAGFVTPTIEQFEKGAVAELLLDTVDLASMGTNADLVSIHLSAYSPFSSYPSALRDIAVWTPERTEESEVAFHIQKEAGELLVRMDLFDRFEKQTDEGIRISYAFRLVFQSNERTLADTDLDPIMERVTKALNAQEGWEVR